MKPGSSKFSLGALNEALARSLSIKSTFLNLKLTSGSTAATNIQFGHIFLRHCILPSSSHPFSTETAWRTLSSIGTPFLIVPKLNGRWSSTVGWARSLPYMNPKRGGQSWRYSGSPLCSHKLLPALTRTIVHSPSATGKRLCSTGAMVCGIICELSQK